MLTYMIYTEFRFTWCGARTCDFPRASSQSLTCCEARPRWWCLHRGRVFTEAASSQRLARDGGVFTEAAMGQSLTCCEALAPRQSLTCNPANGCPRLHRGRVIRPPNNVSSGGNLETRTCVIGISPPVYDVISFIKTPLACLRTMVNRLGSRVATPCQGRVRRSSSSFQVHVGLYHRHRRQVDLLECVRWFDGFGVYMFMF